MSCCKADFCSVGFHKHWHEYLWDRYTSACSKSLYYCTHIHCDCRLVGLLYEWSFVSHTKMKLIMSWRFQQSGKLIILKIFHPACYLPQFGPHGIPTLNFMKPAYTGITCVCLQYILFQSSFTGNACLHYNLEWSVISVQVMYFRNVHIQITQLANNVLI